MGKMAKNANFWTNGPFSIIYQQDLFKPLGLYENVKEWKFKRAKEWKCERVKVWKSESVWKCKTVNSDLNTFSFLLNLYLWLNLILNSGAVLHLHLRWRYLNGARGGSKERVLKCLLKMVKGQTFAPWFKLAHTSYVRRKGGCRKLLFFQNSRWT